MPLLAQMNAVDGNDLHVGRPIVVTQKYASLLEERLIDDSKIVRVKFGHMADAFHDLDELALHAPELVTVGRVVGTEEAGTLDGAGKIARPRHLDAFHRKGEINEGRWHEIDERSI